MHRGGHGFWPNVTQSDEEPFADKFNALQKVVLL